MNNFKKIIAVVLMMQLLPVAAIAQIKNLPTAQMLKMRKGEVAPWDGTLFNKMALALISEAFNKMKKQCVLAITHFVKKERIQCNHRMSIMNTNLETSIKKFNKIMNLKNDEIRKLNKVVVEAEKKKNRKYWWAGGGVLIGIATTVATVFLIREVSK